MTLSIHTIKKTAGSSKKRKRIGRGNASGTGTYSGRGLKGQKSRSGVSGLKRLGMKQVLLRVPKSRGFKSDKPKDAVVNLDEISKNFKDNEEVNPKSLSEKGLVENGQSVKILGRGKLTVKNLQFSDVKMSESVRAQIEKK
jgi:large subunit ribosomal protein L15